jgi:pectin methylesterase-like acyl-CoA thioesterase
MSFTDYQNGVRSFGIPQVGYGIPPMIGKCFVVGGSASFIAPDYGTVQDAVTALGDAGGMLLVQPGSYNETVTLTRSSTSTGPIAIIGLGNKGDCALAPTTVNAGAMVNNRDDVTLVNFGLAANGTGKSLVNTGPAQGLWLQARE